MALVDFPTITFDEANPALVGALKGMQLASMPLQMKKQMLANKLAQIQLQYAPQLAQANLQKINLGNKYYPQAQEANISLANARAQQQQLFSDMLKKISNGAAPNNEGTSANGVSNEQQNQSYSGNNSAAVTPQDILNKKFFGIDTYGPRQALQNQKQMNQYSQQQKELQSSNEVAQASTDLDNLINRWDSVMNNTTFKGPRLGEFPSKGLATFLDPFHDFSNEQQVDYLEKQILPSAVKQLRSAMGSARFSNLDMNMSREMKVSRTMTDKARQTAVEWIHAVNQRNKEKADFDSIINTRYPNLPQNLRDRLWQSYQNNYPLINEKMDKVQSQNLNNYDLFTSPGAIESVVKNGHYKPSKRDLDEQNLKSNLMNTNPEKNENQNDFIIMQGPKGKFKVPLDKVKLFENNNYTRVK